ncbi:sulfite exporter TauE/SafE family protein [Steroidobacter sp. S1-65]|uniref:Probable membrane transporter protein n=1 Tax=Steroidobacter gossypii TaxID=2805490 RepID=A0ABS1WTU9_9GAMM|nr:sulfite exporter TauE/SafE family protein [Steroidobacter gossypii]MBM0104403.1 sulfite exporter TauE/SafE family protein [Steroidobacter gossypii]
MTSFDLLIAALAAVGAGAINALAGGGTLISFPVLVALGVPPVAANITNAVALCPGYFGATIAQLPNLKGQRRQLLLLVPVAVLGGLAGGMILVHTGERTFTALVPWMILAAALLLAIQEPVKKFVVKRLSNPEHKHHTMALSALPIAAAAIYGGFFSAGMSVLLLAVLGLTLDDSLTRLNALKQVLAFSVNIAAAVFFLFSDQVVWIAAAVMAVGALIGGALGGKLAGKLPPAVLRWVVVVAGVAIAIAYWVKSA